MIGTREWRGLLAATVMVQAAGFAVIVAGPSIQADLDASFDQVLLVSAGYLVAFGALTATGARLGDRFGHRSVFRWGVVGFTATSLVCGLAPNAEVLIGGRFLQGAVAAFVLPQVLALVPDEDRRAKVLGVVTAFGVLGGLAGGGLLAAEPGWRAVLFVNVPIGLAILAMTTLLAKGTARSRQLVATPLSLLTVLFFFAASGGLYLVFTYYLRTGFGIGPATTGLMFVPLGVTFVLGSALRDRLRRLVGVTMPVAGTALVACTLYGGALVAQLPRGAQPPLLVVMISIVGFGQGLVIGPLVTGLRGRVAPVMPVGLALGVAVAGVCYQNVLGDDAVAFTFAALLLAGLAMVASLLSAVTERHRNGPTHVTYGARSASEAELNGIHFSHQTK
jgi:MFS family permease